MHQPTKMTTEAIQLAIELTIHAIVVIVIAMLAREMHRH